MQPSSHLFVKNPTGNRGTSAPIVTGLISRWNSETCRKRFNPLLKLYLTTKRERNSLVSKPGHRDLKRALDSRPKIRTRKNGLVGPEPDWSVVYSDLPMDLVYRLNPGNGGGNEAYYHGKMAHEPLIPEPLSRTGLTWGRINRNAEVELFDLKEILNWTRIAHASGVCFKGERGYSLSKALWKEPLPEWVNHYDYLMNRPVHRRSCVSKINRARLRRVREGNYKFPSTIPLRVRLPSCKVMRKDWQQSFGPRTVSFQDFKKASKPSLHMWFPHVTKPSNLVIESLIRIYSRTVVKPPEVSFKWAEPGPSISPLKPPGWIPGQHGKAPPVTKGPSRRKVKHLAHCTFFEDRTELLNKLGMKYRMDTDNRVHSVLGGPSIYDGTLRDLNVPVVVRETRWASKNGTVITRPGRLS